MYLPIHICRLQIRITGIVYLLELLGVSADLIFQMLFLSSMVPIIQDSIAKTMQRPVGSVWRHKNNNINSHFHSGAKLPLIMWHPLVNHKHHAMKIRQSCAYTVEPSGNFIPR